MTLRDRIIEHEGDGSFAYQDPRGFWSIGYGFCIDQRAGTPIPQPVKDFWLNWKLADVDRQLDREIAWWRSRPEPVQDTLREITYQLGIGGLLGFKRMLAALQAGDYATAHQEAINSDWHKETPQRCETVTACFLDYVSQGITS